MSSVVKIALPILGAIVGSVIPGLGTALGASLGGAVGGYVGGRSYGGGNTGGLIGAAGGAAGGYLSGGYGASDWLGSLGSSATTSGVSTEGATAALGSLGTDTATGAATDMATSTAANAAVDSTGGISGDMLATGMGGPGTSLTTSAGGSGSLIQGTAGETMGAGASATGAADGSGMSMLDRLKAMGESKGAMRGAINVGTGLYGMVEANRLRSAADPFAKYRAGYGQQLAALEANPGSMTTMPGYQAGLQAVERAGAAQGYTGSGNMNAALAGYGQNFFDNQSQRLATLAGAGAPVGQGAAAGYVAENNAFKGIGNGLGGYFGG